MGAIKKNIWSLFSVVLLAGFVLIIYDLSQRWVRNNDAFYQFQYTQVDQLSNTTEAFLKSQESLLDILGNQLAIDSKLPKQPQHSLVLDRVLATNPVLAGLGLANPDGQLVVTSSNLKLENLPNLLTSEVSRDSFIKTQNSTRLVVGRTYLLDALQDLSMAMAIRKSIRAKSGDVIAVMTAGIKVSQSVFFDKTPDYHQMAIIRDDGYLQFSTAHSKSTDIYNKPISVSLIDKMVSRVTQENSISEQTLKTSKQPYPLTMDLGHGPERLVVEYDPYFNFWIVSSIAKRYINQQFYSSAIIVFLVYLGTCIMFFMLARSISRSEKEKLVELRFQALHDSLTGLPNQRYLDQLISQMGTDTLAIICINIDRFKVVNDAYGYTYGDKALIEIANRLETFTANNIWLTRGMGDEFFLVIQEDNALDLTSLCDDIQQSISSPYVLNGIGFLLSASIAVAKPSTKNRAKDEIMRSLDIVMRQAKNTRNTTRFVTPEIQNEYLELIKIEHRLRKAIQEKRLYMVYQPLVNAVGELSGVEALVRWVDDKLGMVPPDKFIPIAEHCGLMLELGNLIFDLTMRDMAFIRREKQCHLPVSLNVSVKQFFQDQFVEDLVARLNQYQISPSTVTIEITESVFIEDIHHVKNCCDKLREQGLTLSLDDFGTGYSSLSLLSGLPINELKIDKSFVDEVNHSQQSLLMVENIIGIARNYGMSVLAEGVETEAQKNSLLKLGCDCFQGYLFSKPLKIEQLSQYME